MQGASLRVRAAERYCTLRGAVMHGRMTERCCVHVAQGQLRQRAGGVGERKRQQPLGQPRPLPAWRPRGGCRRISRSGGSRSQRWRAQHRRHPEPADLAGWPGRGTVFLVYNGHGARGPHLRLAFCRAAGPRPQVRALDAVEQPHAVDLPEGQPDAAQCALKQCSSACQREALWENLSFLLRASCCDGLHIYKALCGGSGQGL